MPGADFSPAVARDLLKIANLSEDRDSHLVIQLQGGSLDALGELYDRHQRLVYRTAQALR